MESLLFLIEKNYIILLIIEIIASIVLLVKATKRDKKEHWICLFTIEILFIMMSRILTYYVSNKTYSGWEGLSIALIIGFGVIVNRILVFISFCIKIRKFENNNRKLNKQNMNPIVLISGVTLVFVGCFFLFNQIYNNWGYRGTTIGVVSNVMGGSNGHFADVTYEVDGEEYEDTYINTDFNMKKGEKIKVSYFYYNSEYHLHDYYQYAQNYLPPFIIGALLIIYRFKKKQD